MAEFRHEPPVDPGDALLIENADRRAIPKVAADNRSLGDLFKELSDETKLLVRQEVALAKKEASESMRKGMRNAGYAAGGGFVAYAGFIVALMGLGLLLGLFMPDWLGLLIVGVVVVIIGYALLQKGINGFKKTDFALDRTMRTLQNDGTFVRQEAQEIKRDPANLGAQHSTHR